MSKVNKNIDHSQPSLLAEVAILLLKERVATETLDRIELWTRFLAVMDSIPVNGVLSPEISSLKAAIARHRMEFVDECWLYGL